MAKAGQKQSIMGGVLKLKESGWGSVDHPTQACSCRCRVRLFQSWPFATPAPA